MEKVMECHVEYENMIYREVSLYFLCIIYLYMYLSVFLSLSIYLSVVSINLSI